jgi:alkylation response protein AidB-like acyl-CoA dehydrogenase
METRELETAPTLATLPGDDIRQIMWRFADRYDLQMLVQSARAVARGPVARLVAEGGRNTHEWTSEKAALLKAFDDAGLTAAYMDPERGGYIEGPKSLAMALIAFELAWVDAGAATSSMAGTLALAPIHERGTPEQKQTYMTHSLPQAGIEPWRGAFCLTEPLPYVGVDTNMLSGKARVVEWEEGKEPILHVEKRGRFITGASFANFVVAAVASDDERIKGTFMVILEQADPGTFDPGAPTRKLVHQLSSTGDPIYSVRVPANRIIGGYTVKDDVIVPRYGHGQVIEAVFRRTRVTVGLMTSAKLLSAVEPIIRYQRGRFRGGEAGAPGSARYEHGLQQKEDALHRLVDVWAAGEAGASLGFAAARLFDGFDPLEREMMAYFEERGITGGRAQLREFTKVKDAALEYIRLAAGLEGEPPADILVRYSVVDSLAQVLCPACKLWNTGQGVNMMREAVSLMGGYGVTEDCPGFLTQKWMDAQLEATYEGPEAVQRRQLAVTMVNDLFLAQFRQWMGEMRQVAGRTPGTGACSVAAAMEVWLHTLEHLRQAKDPDGHVLYHSQRQGVAFPMADALCWLLASRYQILDVLELEEKGGAVEGLEGYVRFFTDLCNVQAARAAAEAGRICTELLFGYLPRQDHAGPFEGLETFRRLRRELDGCLTGCRLAKDRAAQALTEVMIPEALDYPA